MKSLKANVGMVSRGQVKANPTFKHSSYAKDQSVAASQPLPASAPQPLPTEAQPMGLEGLIAASGPLPSNELPKSDDQGSGNPTP